jgi:hypothetical protein
MLRRISRRRLVAITSVGVAAWLSGILSLITGYSAPGSWGIDAELNALCSELACSPAVGGACLLALPPDERGLFSLSSAILGSKSSPREGGPSSRALAQSIKQMCSADFQDGRVVIVNGWIVALTEARLYALATLLAGTEDRGVGKQTKS